MHKSTLVITTSIVAVATLMMFSLDGHADRKKASVRGIVGPDVVDWYAGGSGDLDMEDYGSGDGVYAYAFGTTSCNWGDVPATWGSEGNTSYPVIAQNCYRLKDGRFEQIGLAWLKHSFCAVSEPGCGSCQSTPCSTLGIGCADTYWAGLNADATAPRSEINAFTGEYSYPFSISPSGPSWSRGRLLLETSDLNNADASYFIEGQYVCSDEAPYNNQFNNCSWREVEFSNLGNPGALNQTQVAEPAIFAWKEKDNEVEIQTIQVPNDGQIHVGSRAYDNGDGTWDYEYAIHNMNSHRSVGGVMVAYGNSEISDIGFHDVDYHSGEVIDSTDWSWGENNGVLSWNTTVYEENQWANAIRWGSVYNFRFTSTGAPESGDMTMTLFRPGSPDSITVQAVVPQGSVVDPCDLPVGECPSDVNGDNLVSVSDILEVIAAWGECGDGTYRPAGDVDGDCCVAVADILEIIGAWGMDCTPVGACCVSGGCVEDSTAEYCEDLGGSYLGDDSSCATCPVPGACCFSDGSCSDLLAGDCAAQGGAFQGESSDCETEICPVSGAGDECKSAMIAYMGENSFNTTEATSSENPPSDDLCPGTYLDWSDSQDVWFSFIPKQSGEMLFTTCDQASYDTSIVLYQGDCGNQVACNGDASSGSGCQAYHSAIEYDVDAGNMYYIRIGGWLGETGSGTLTIE